MWGHRFNTCIEEDERHYYVNDGEFNNTSDFSMPRCSAALELWQREIRAKSFRHALNFDHAECD